MPDIKELEEGLSTEADVRARFGEPARIWPEAGGASTFEYNRQPEGHVNYMITIAAGGTMTALTQVLTPENFARVQPGMDQQAVRRLLGQPARKVTYAIASSLGWLGVAGYGVDWCVEGLDRNFAYGADCRAARP